MWICTCLPYVGMTQLSTELNKALPEKVRPLDFQHPTTSELISIFNEYPFFYQKTDSTIRSELRQVATKYGAQYKSITPKTDRLQFSMAMSVFWYYETVSDSVLKYNNFIINEVDRDTSYYWALSYALQTNGGVKILRNMHREGYSDLKQAIEVCEKMQFLENLEYTYVAIAMMFYKLQLFDRAIQQIDSSLSYMDKFPKTTITLNNVAIQNLYKVSCFIAKYNESKKAVFLDSAETIAARISRNNGSEFHQQSRIKAVSYLVQIKYMRGDYTSALAFADSGSKLDIANAHDVANKAARELAADIRNAYKGLSLLKLNRNEEAISLIKKINLDRDDPFVPSLLNELYVFQKGKGRYSEALAYYEKLFEYTNENQLNKFRGEVFELESQYDIAKKNHQIDELQNKQKNLAKVGFLVFVLICTLFIGVVRRYRNNQKKARILVSQIEDLTDTHLSQIEETEERIRLEIGRELHDDLSASIAASSRYLRMKQLNETDKAEKKLIERIANMLEESYNLVRGRSHEIIFGEVQARFWDRLTDQVNLFFAGTSMKVDLMIEPDGVRLSADQKSILLYCLREGITNIIKHAKATEVRIILYHDPGWIVLKIIDDGRGFSPNLLTQGVGLKSLSDRAGNLNGRMSVKGTKSGGTQLELALPSET